VVVVTLPLVELVELEPEEDPPPRDVPDVDAGVAAAAVCPGNSWATKPITPSEVATAPAAVHQKILGTSRSACSRRLTGSSLRDGWWLGVMAAPFEGHAPTVTLR
jgi:hypothetical protein